jgi:hypothetical protein
MCDMSVCMHMCEGQYAGCKLVYEREMRRLCVGKMCFKSLQAGVNLFKKLEGFRH